MPINEDDEQGGTITEESEPVPQVAPEGEGETEEPTVEEEPNP